MSHPLDGEVTRPDHFNPKDDYALVIPRGDEQVGDYDLVDLQAIMRHDLAVILSGLYREGAILVEAGGTIATPVPGANLGSDELGAAGTYVGLESQLYQVTILANGAAGVATYTWSSTGSDNPNVAGTPVVVRAVAPTLNAGLGDLATYGHDVGTNGVQVVFVNATGILTGGNTWVIQATYGSRPPTVSGTVITVADLLIYGGDGKMYRVAGGALTYGAAGSGISVVYGELTRSIVRDTEDPTLTDPQSDEGQSWRVQWRMVLRTTDTSQGSPGPRETGRRVFALYRWDRATNIVTRVIEKPYAIDLNRTEGSLDARRLLNVDQNVLLQGTLARRDTGAHGDGYVIAPAPPQARAAVSTNTATAGKIRLSLPPIRASVKGVEVVRPLPVELEVDQASDTLHVADEPHVYASGTDTYPLNKGANLPFFPTKQITKVTATVQVGVAGTGGYEAVTRGVTDDVLSKTPVVSLIRISNTQGGGANYTLGTHYSLVGNAVHWITGGPGTGATYYVVYQYQKVMVQGADFALSGDSVDFAPAGDNPVDTTTFQVDYDYYVPRFDTVVLGPTGDLTVIKGLPAEDPVTPPPPLSTLAYCRVEIPPNSNAVALRRFPNDAMPMEKLNLLVDAVIELTRDVAILDIRQQAIARGAALATTANTAGLIDILAEAFTTTAVADLAYNVGSHVFSALLDLELGELTVPNTATLAAPAKVSPPGAETDVHLGQAFYTLPFTHELALDSSKWSDTHKVNPYADFSAEPPLIALEPSSDNWVDTTAVTTTDQRTIQRGRAKVVARVFTEVAVTASEVPAVFMRQIPITIRGFHFVPGEKVRVKFDRKDVAFTAVAPSTQGGDGFTVLARASDASHTYGEVTGTITIPANVPTGDASVDLYGDQAAGGSTWPGSYSIRARTKFSSSGIQREVATEVTTVTVRNDPIAQSFLFPAARMVSRVDIPMATKAPNLGPPLVVELRATDRSGAASTPIDDVLGRVSREAADLNVGVASANVIDFPDPVHMTAQEYRALVLRSASNAYQAYVAKVGFPDRGSGGFINAQAIPAGIFMDSSNNTDWTPHQGADLRFRAYVAKFSPLEARLYLARVSVANTTGFYLAPDQVVPDGTSIEWQYSVDGVALGGGGKVWTTFVPFQIVELTATTGTLDVRAILRTADAYVSPAIHARNLSVLVQVNATTSKYVSRRKVLSQAVTTIHGTVDLATPPGGNHDVFVSANDGATWVEATLTAGQPTGDGFIAHAFTATGLTSGARLRARIDQSTPNRAQRPRARELVAYAPPV